MPDTCRSCGAPLRWCRVVPSGRRMPLDAAPDPAGNVVLQSRGEEARVLSRGELAALPADVPRYRSHHASCPTASAHRRPARPVQGDLFADAPAPDPEAP